MRTGSLTAAAFMLAASFPTPMRVYDPRGRQRTVTGTERATRKKAAKLAKANRKRNR